MTGNWRAAAFINRRQVEIKHLLLQWLNTYHGCLQALGIRLRDPY
jgi:hypothetical protein